MNKKGFTLVELIAVLAIVSILSTFVLVNIIQKANKMKQISSDEVDEALISSAKTYVSKNTYLKSRVKSGEIVEIEYTTLKNEGYLPDNMLHVTTYQKMDINDSSICFKYVDNKYTYYVRLKDKCE